MAMRQKTHVAAPKKQHEITLRAMPCGGFTISNGRDPEFGRNCSYPDQMASFTTLDEALAWLRVNMAEPATAPTAKAPT